VAPVNGRNGARADEELDRLPCIRYPTLGSQEKRSKPKAAHWIAPFRTPLQNGAMIYGYARVSTDGQSVDAQVRQLRAAGAATVFREVASGAKTDRAQRGRLLG
jgi:predicted site-specific integrase-resolvase